MSKWIVDIHGEMEGDYEIIGKYDWIPVSEGLPEKDGRYLTYIVNPYDRDLRYIMVCDFSASEWGPWYPDDPTASDDVVAWMSLPEPYKPEKEVER